MSDAFGNYMPAVCVFGQTEQLRPRKWRIGGQDGTNVGVRPRKWRFGGRVGADVGVCPRKWRFGGRMM